MDNIIILSLLNSRKYLEDPRTPATSILIRRVNLYFPQKKCEDYIFANIVNINIILNFFEFLFD